MQLKGKLNNRFLLAFVIMVVVVAGIGIYIVTTRPTVNVTFLNSEVSDETVAGVTNSTKYVFKVTVTGGTLTFEDEKVNKAIAPLLGEYNLIFHPVPLEEYSNFSVPVWGASEIVDGEGTFWLYCLNTFSDSRINALTNDLQADLASLIT